MDATAEKLRRIDDSCWQTELNGPQHNGIRFLHITAPSHNIAKVTANWLRYKGIPEAARHDLRFRLIGEEGRVTYRIRIIRWKDSLLDKLWKKLPFFHYYTRTDVASVEVVREKRTTGCWPCWRRKPPAYLMPSLAMIQPKSYEVTVRSRAEQISSAHYSDPFSRAARHALKYWDKYFVTRKELQSNIRLIVRDGTISQEANTLPLSPEEIELNKATVRGFQQHLIREVGEEELRQIEHRFEFDLAKMIEEGEPLLPEHVYRANIGIANFEAQHVETIYGQIKQLYSSLPQDGGDGPALPFLAASNPILTVQALRALYQQLTKEVTEPTIDHLREWLRDLCEDTPCSADELKPVQFSKLVELIKIDSAHWDHIFTGRKILTPPIMGAYTLDDESGRSKRKPWLDQHELLQSFDALCTTEWPAYFEQITHIACKKHLIRADPDTVRRVGALIPAPNDAEGKPRYYRVESCVYDSSGDFHYLLKPACKNSGLPVIWLYRSTASDAYALDGQASVRSDIHPYYEPGAGRRDLSGKYDNPYLFANTIPLWVGYHIQTRQQFEKLCQELQATEALKEAIDPDSKMDPVERNAELTKLRAEWEPLLRDMRCAMIGLTSDKLRDIENKLADRTLEVDEREQSTVERDHLIAEREQLYEHINRDSAPSPDILNPEDVPKWIAGFVSLKEAATEYDAYLEESMIQRKETPENKEEANIVLCGHSLGGALAQSSLHHFAINLGRIPLPGYKYRCVSFDAPGISFKTAEQFHDATLAHQHILEKVNEPWTVEHQFEYGDFVAEAGGLHLGAPARDDERPPWVQFVGRFMRPLPGAHHPEIRDLTTAHARRYLRATMGEDYQETHFTAQGMTRFDTQWLLDKDFRQISGLHSPRGLNLLRRIFGAIPWAVMCARDKFNRWRRVVPIRADGGEHASVTFCGYNRGVHKEEVAEDQPTTGCTTGFALHIRQSATAAMSVWQRVEEHS